MIDIKGNQKCIKKIVYYSRTVLYSWECKVKSSSEVNNTMVTQTEVRKSFWKSDDASICYVFTVLNRNVTKLVNSYLKKKHFFFFLTKPF